MRPTLIALTIAAATLLLPACGAASTDADDSPSEDGAAASASAASGPTAAWDRLLRAHGKQGGIDYAAVKADRSDLDTYLDYIRQTDPSSLSENDRLAFWINVYNAVTVDRVLERYPGIESVRDVDGFFKEDTFPVGGEPMTLDAIEGASREMDVRVHFAVVCASTSCPDLRPEAYVGARVDEQLREQTHAFLADTEKGLRYEEKGNDVHLSSIFKWYAGDFTGGSTIVAFFARGGVLDWVVEHVGDEQLAKTLEEKDPGVKYLDYDWSLNDRK